MTFGELLDRWLTVKGQSVEPSTLKSYEWVAARNIRPALGDRRLAAIRPLDLDQLYASLFGSGLSARTVRICHTVVRQSLEQARRWGLIARSPAVDATPPAQRPRDVRPPTVSQVRELIEAARMADPDFGAYLWVLEATGCRRGEGCALRWTDVDLDGAQLTIRRSIGMAGGTPYEKGTKTHQARRVALDVATVAVLGEHRWRMRERLLALVVRLGRLGPQRHQARTSRGRPGTAASTTTRSGRPTTRNEGGVNTNAVLASSASVACDEIRTG